MFKNSVQRWNLFLILASGPVVFAHTLLFANAALANTLAPSAPAAPEWITQTSAVAVTGVSLETSDTSLQIQLKTTGELSTPTSEISGNALIIEFPNTVLTLPEAYEFLEFEPADDIAVVQITELSGEQIQVVVTGTDAPPTAEISSSTTGLTLGIVPGTAQADATDDDAIQLLVTGADSDYVEPTASTATRTDTPLRDTPHSIQVIPQEVLEDQGVISLTDAIRNVSGVVTTGDRPSGQFFAIRGFDIAPVLRDGFRFNSSFTSSNVGDLANVERIEVLKGPASILAGNVQPGGAINLISERPLSEPTYEAGFRVGNRGLIEPSLDFTGPLTTDGSLSYRLNALVRREDYYRDFEALIDREFIAPMLSWQISDSTDLLVELEYRNDNRPADNAGIPAIDGSEPDIPFDRALSYRDLESTTETTRLGYQFEHRFSDNWKIRNASYYGRFDTSLQGNAATTLGLDLYDFTTGTVNLVPSTTDAPSSTAAIQTNIVGEFSTGSIEHTLLAGVDFYQQRDLGLESRAALQLLTIPGFGTFPVPTITDTLNIFDPDYDTLSDFDTDDFLTLATTEGRTENWGFYVQDQIKVFDNLNLLAGLRFDTVYQEQTVAAPLVGVNSESDSLSEAFTPRLGLVYQPIEEISLYGSYSRSFTPNSGVTVVGDLLDPEEGEQFEIGARAEILGGRLVANLALFDIDRSNIAITNTLTPGFFVGEGGESIRGVELDMIGEILPGWNVVANYAYLDSEITESDNPAAIGNRQRNIPEHNVNLWTNYTLQDGPLEGLSIGLGGNFLSERFADEANTITLDDYFLTNAAIGYERDDWKAALNFRNLFDVDYIEGSTSGGLVLFPGRGFTVVGSFSVKF
ncbi:MAG: TonB-dependent siderophore receptor [Cyanobacteria bacterium P01_B01_bin.77]